MPVPAINALPQLPASNWSPAYGGQPATPAPGSTQARAIGANIGNLGQLYNLAGNVNQFNTAQAGLALARNMPGYQQAIDQSGRNINQGLRGEVQSDVTNLLLRNAAERGLGAGGGSNTNAAWLGALGRTSYEQMQDAERNLTGAIARTPTGPQFNPSQFFISPGDMQGAAVHAANVAASPVPSAAAAAAEAAALRGLRTGAGAGGGGLMPVDRSGGGYGGATTWGNLSAPGEVVGNSTGTGTISGGSQTPQGPSSWNDWMRSWNVPRGTNGSGYPDMGAGGDWDMWGQDMGSNLLTQGAMGGAGAGQEPVGGDEWDWG